MPMVFWYLTYILTSEKYYPLVMERIRSYALPNTNITSENIFDVPSLLADPLLQACFQETLRLRTQNGSVRIVNEATTIPITGKEYHLRQGSIVFIVAPLIHMDTDIYTNVEEYRPERFVGADLESTLVKGDHATLDEEKPMVDKKTQTPKFYKNGVPVKHYMMPFGGGDNLVLLNFCKFKGLMVVYWSTICAERDSCVGLYVVIFIRI
jgi:cytochrome P450